MSGAARNGAIITFYSYKGGVGRSFALANIAVLMARYGLRVLCVDWDLEAPGLSLYFRDRVQGTAVGGLVDVLRGECSWRDAIVPVVLDRSMEGSLDLSLDLLPSSAIGDASYPGKLQSIDWERAFVDGGMAERLEAMRSEWKADYDFVLIDSRTGISDSGGICTIQLPDILVVVLTANEQSLQGVVDVERRAQAQRQKLPFDRARVPCLPLPSRYDGRVEYERAKRWLDRFEEALAPMYQPWLERGVPVRALLERVRIPYVAHWSFGEDLAVLTESGREPDSISYALETCAALLVNHLADTRLLAESRDEFVAKARASAQPKPINADQYEFDLFVSYARSERDLAQSLIEGLGRHGLRVWKPESWDGFSEDLRGELHRAINRSRSMLVLSPGGELSGSQNDGLKFALSALYESTAQGRRIVPVLGPDTAPNNLLASLQSVRMTTPGSIDDALLGAVVKSLGSA